MTTRRFLGRFERDALRVLATTATTSGVGLVTGVIVARGLGVHDRGVFQLLLLLAPTLGGVTKLGMPQATVHAIRQCGADVGTATRVAVTVAAGAAITTAVFVWSLHDWLLAHVLPGASPAMLATILLLTPASAIQSCLVGTTQAREQFHEWGIVQVVPTIARCMAMIVVLYGLGLGLAATVVTHVAVALVALAWLVIRFARELGFRPAWDAGVAATMLRFGAKSQAQTAASALHVRVDQYLLAWLLDPTQVGLYAIAANAAAVLLGVPNAIGTVLFPRLSAADERDARRATVRACRRTGLLVLTLAGGLAFAAPRLIPLVYGAPFAGAVPPLLLLLPGVGAMAIYAILSRSFTSRGRQQVNVLATTTALVVNVALNLVLIPRAGIAGAAIASSASYVLACCILVVAFVLDAPRRS